MKLRKRGMGGIIGFGFRYIKYLMCIQSEPKQSVSLDIHTLFITYIRFLQEGGGWGACEMQLGYSAVRREERG